ncbi:MAG: type II toxin-antitoxin system RelE/ParE family toxin [Flavobacteriales bacterium]|nr:type II toxin-antitoxin system RelE/ParE family toxin [Flavobacteriales bacterium]MBP9081292.1 type II toxin-antitoxin system RelE/ParE family toxin [Flavobacteriales bacterium]
MAEVAVTAAFKRRYKRLAKRHRSLEQDVLGLISSLEEQPMQGTPPGKDCYKIRLTIASKSGGKSGGARVITYVRLVKGKVYLLTIYDKGDQASLSTKELQALVDSIG